MTSLKTIKTKKACPLSYSHDAFVVSDIDRHGNKLRNIICNDSALIFVDPVPFENTEEFYRKEYRESYKGISKPKSKHVYRAGLNAVKRFKRIQNLIDFKGDVLDAGSSSGEFVYLLKTKKMGAFGLEANEGYSYFGKKELDIEVSTGSFSKFQAVRDFDAITMFHVLEHIENPIRDLMHLTGFLKQGGHLIIEVPNILYPNMAFRNKWHPGHLFSFCKNTLSKLAQKISMEVIFCDQIDDGGNLFAVFKKSRNLNSAISTEEISAEDKLRLLFRQKRDYYYKPFNYFKFFSKLKKLIVEKSNSNGKSAMQILDSIYNA